MKLFKHPATYIFIAFIAITVGIFIDVQSLREPAGLILSVIFVVCLIAGILTGTGVIFKK